MFRKFETSANMAKYAHHTDVNLLATHWTNASARAPEETSGRAFVQLGEAIDVLSSILTLCVHASAEKHAEYMLERELWKTERSQLVNRISEMEAEGEACIGHLEGRFNILHWSSSHKVFMSEWICFTERIYQQLETVFIS
jgi:hypothetical protein